MDERTAQPETHRMNEYLNQYWIDDKHGRVISGPLKGCLLRGGVSDGPYIDILVPGGWNRLDRIYVRNDENPDGLTELKRQVDNWLSEPLPREDIA